MVGEEIGKGGRGESIEEMQFDRYQLDLLECFSICVHTLGYLPVRNITVRHCDLFYFTTSFFLLIIKDSYVQGLNPSFPFLLHSWIVCVVLVLDLGTPGISDRVSLRAFRDFLVSVRKRDHSRSVQGNSKACCLRTWEELSIFFCFSIGIRFDSKSSVSLQ